MSCSRRCAQVPGALVRADRAVPLGGRLLVGDHGRGRAHGQPRLADLLLGTGRRDGVRGGLPAGARAGDVHRHGPSAHDRIKALFQRGFTPKRIADHEQRIRAITCDVLDRLEGRDSCDLVSDVAQPVVSRVISSFMGLVRGRRRAVGADHELGARTRRPGPRSRRRAGRARKGHPRDCSSAAGR